MGKLPFLVIAYIFILLFAIVLFVVVVKFTKRKALKNFLLIAILAVVFVTLIIPFVSLIRSSYLKPVYIDAVSDNSGGTIVSLWRNGVIYLRRLGSDGKTIWTKQIGHGSYRISFYKVSSNNSGRVVLFWGESQSQGLSPYFLYAQSIDANGNCLWGGNDVLISSQAVYNVPCNILNNGLGGAFFSWIVVKDGYEIRIQRVDALGNVLWGKDGKQIVSSKSRIGDLNLVGNLDRVFVVWTVEQENNSHIYVQILDLDGNNLLQSGGLRIDTNSWYCRNVYALSDNSGGAIIVFQEGYEDPAPIYAIRIDSQGKRIVEKVKIASGEPSYIRIAPQKDGFILSWVVSPRTIPLFPKQWTLHIQKFSYLFTALWDEKVVYVSEGTEGRLDFNLGTSDGYDSFVVWQNVSSPAKGGLLYAQKLNSEGKELWGSSGTLVSSYNLLFYPSSPHVVPDGAGGMIVISLMKNFWGTKYIIFFQKFSSSGNPLWAKGAIWDF